LETGLLEVLRAGHHDVLEIDRQGRTAAHYLSLNPSTSMRLALLPYVDLFRYDQSRWGGPGGMLKHALDEDDDAGGGWFASGGEAGAENARETFSTSLKQALNTSVGNDTLKQGWLKKKRGGMMWLRRFVVLTEDYIIYYKNEQSLHLPKFAIPLEDITVRRPPNTKELSFEVTSPNMVEKKSFFGNSSSSGGKKSIQFLVESEQDLQEWMLPLKLIAGVEENLRPPNSSAPPITYVNLLVRQLWVSQRDHQGNTPLHVLAFLSRNREKLRLYLKDKPYAEKENADAGAVNEKTFAKAAAEQVVQLAAWLIESGCPVNAQNSRGQTALHCCAYDFRKSIVNETNASCCHRELMRCLLLKGADLTKVRDRKGCTPLEVISAVAVSSATPAMPKHARKYLESIAMSATQGKAPRQGGSSSKQHQEGGSGLGVLSTDFSGITKLKGYSYLSIFAGKSIIIDDK
jgi:ankyrin repeat protein